MYLCLVWMLNGEDSTKISYRASHIKYNQFLSCDISVDDLSFMEHVFELCRRPDLLTTVIEYRLKKLNSSEDELPARQCIRVPSAKKYMGKLMLKIRKSKLSLKEALQLAV